MAGRDQEWQRKIREQQAAAAKPAADLRRRKRQAERRQAASRNRLEELGGVDEERERRIAAQLAATRAAARRTRRRRLAWGGVGTALALAVVALFIALGGQDWKKAPLNRTRPIPAERLSNLTQAAAAAGCQLKLYPKLSGGHVREGTHIAYKTNPPSFGPHPTQPVSDGDFVGKRVPTPGPFVHALEHGRIEIEYSPRLSNYTTGQLETLFNQRAGSYGPAAYLLLFQNQTHMPYDVSAVAWGKTLTCAHFNDRVFDAIRAFRTKYTLEGTERVVGPE